MKHPNHPELRSFIPVSSDSDFPVQNLPWGLFRRHEASESSPEVGVAIGDQVLSLTRLEQKGLLKVASEPLFQSATLNPLMEQESETWKYVRECASHLLREDNPQLRDDSQLRQAVLLPQDQLTMLLPAVIGDYTDFYSSREHATNVGTMFRDKDHPLLANWLHLPVGYHGRASSVVISGTPVRRPKGQLMPPGEELPVFAPSKRLDFELEMAFFVGGKTNRLGVPIPLAEAEKNIFGLVLMNDWSARDIQKWEYQPLGPFVSKSFATSISPWVVSMEALMPFASEGPVQEPLPLPYLRHSDGGKHHFNIELAVDIRTRESSQYQTICRSNSRGLYWSMAQQLTHHTVTGCNVRPGDLMASGTISGQTPESRGSLLELTWGGQQPLALKDHQSRSFIEDGDEIRMRAWAEGPGFRIGFGCCTGQVLPALDAPASHG
ncbi:MAG: fumarylacetoacetase [Deltaproteobacteria bacterium]|nr:fumarylacetoacetase [Deltaproteobacteria bacterium]